MNELHPGISHLRCLRTRSLQPLQNFAPSLVNPIDLPHATQLIFDRYGCHAAPRILYHLRVISSLSQMKVLFLYSALYFKQAHTHTPMANELPVINAAHTRFLQRRNDTLYITELPNQDRALPPPSPELLHELRELIDRFASIGLTRPEVNQKEILMDELESAGRAQQASALTTITTTKKIRHLVCRYETQQNDRLMEEQFKLSLHRASDVTVPHTHYGLVAHAIGAFLPHCTRLGVLRVHTCDHERLRQHIHRIPSLCLTVIQNDASNGFWNTASLALFAQLRSDDQVQRGNNGYNAVVIAHTNASTAFAAPEWALATYLFMRDQEHNAPDAKFQGNPKPGSRHVLHDFADGFTQRSLDAAFAIVKCTAATVEPRVNRQTWGTRFAFLQQPASSRQRIEFSTISPDFIFLVECGRNAFIPYVDRITNVSREPIRITDHREHVPDPDADEIAGQFSVPRVFQKDRWQFEFQGDGVIHFGYNMFNDPMSMYNVEHDLLIVKYRELLVGERVSISERRPRRETKGSACTREVDEMIARKLRQYLPPVLPHVHIKTESKYGGISASRALLAQGTVQHLIVDFYCDNGEDGINHANDNYGREYEVFQVTEANAAEVAEQNRILARRDVTSNLHDTCELIANMRRVDKLTIVLKFDNEYAVDTHVGSNQMRHVLNTFVAAQCGIPRLAIQNVSAVVADACLLHLLHRTSACLLMDLTMEVRAREDRDEEYEDDISEIALQNVIGAREGVIMRQLLSLTITTIRVPNSTFVRMDYLPDLLEACVGLEHLNLDMRYFPNVIRHRVQAVILRTADRLRSFQYRTGTDDMADHSSFTAAFLRRATNAAFIRIDASIIENGINDVADALVTCLGRTVAEQINVACESNDTFQNARLRRLLFAAREPHGPGRSNVGLWFRANFQRLRVPEELEINALTGISRHRNRELNANDDYRLYRTPSTNDVFVEIAIEQVFENLSLQQNANEEEDDEQKMTIEPSGGSSSSIIPSDGTGRLESLMQRDHVTHAIKRREAQRHQDAHEQLAAFHFRSIPPEPEEPASDDNGLGNELNAAREAFAHEMRIEIAEVVTGRRPITPDTRARHPEIEAITERVRALMKLTGAPEDLQTQTFQNVLRQLTKDAHDEARQQQEADDVMEWQARGDSALYRAPVNIESAQVVWDRAANEQRLGGYVPFAGERTLLTREDRRALDAVDWSNMDPIEHIPVSDPRGDIVVMEPAHRYALETQLRADQLHRTLWLFSLAENIRLSPQTTVQLRNFAPEVPMAASRAAYQAYRLTATSTLGCPTFGRFFDGTGFALQGFPTPGSRPQDVYASIRVARYLVDVVPGPRAVVSRNGRRMLVMEHQLDAYGVVFGNENVAHATVPARYAVLTGLDVPLVDEIMQREIAAGATANAIIRRVIQQISDWTTRVPSGMRCARQPVHFIFAHRALR